MEQRVSDERLEKALEIARLKGMTKLVLPHDADVRKFRHEWDESLKSAEPTRIRVLQEGAVE